MSSRFSLRALCLAAAIALAVAAPLVPGHAEEAASPRIVHTSDVAEVRLGDAGLAEKVTVGNVAVKPMGQIKKAMFQVENNNTDPLHLIYKVEWQDADGFPISLPTVWQDLFLSSHEKRSVGLLGKSPKAHRMLVSIQRADD